MKSLCFLILAAASMVSCRLYSRFSSSQARFPLERAFTIPVGEDVQGMAVADDWIVVDTYGEITAVDLNTRKDLWSREFAVNQYGQGFQIVNNRLLAASQDQIIFLDKQGQQSEVTLAPVQGLNNIIKVAGVTSRYLYVVRSSEWNIEAYDIARDTMLWKMFVGRDIGNVIYDDANNAVYLTTGSLRAFDNSTGKPLWEIEGIGAIGDLDAGVLYVVGTRSGNSLLRVDAIAAANQEQVWSTEIPIRANSSYSELTLIDNLVMISGEVGLIALDKATGREIWKVDVGEKFTGSVVGFKAIIYAKGVATGTVYAVSSADGSIIGAAQVERPGLFGVAKGGVFRLPDGVIFNARRSIVVYR